MDPGSRFTKLPRSVVVICGNFKNLVIFTPALAKSAPQVAIVVPIPTLPVPAMEPATVKVEEVTEVPIPTAENNALLN